MEIEIISSPDAPAGMGPYSQATRAGQFIFCAGQGGTDPATGTLVEGGIREQTRQTIRNLQAILEAGGSDLSHVVMVTVLLHDWMYFDEMNEVFEEFFGEKPPARSTIQGERRPEGALVAMSAIAVTKTD
ncbi:MAG TPA: Rid family detoxifying hydrolase [Candidatus Kapabacteria bacterium]|nr:Rid family detoxifying hydrolase [Candidatus Kapabacteria bacterium]